MRATFWPLLGLLAAPGLARDIYQLDATNTQVSLNVHPFGLPWFSARFAELSGEFAPQRGAAAGRVDVSVRTASLACESQRWRARLLSPEWFDAQHYPQITYHSQRIHYQTNGNAIVDGELTIHGYTRPAALTVRGWTCSPVPDAHDSCSFDARTQIRRSDYGLPHGFWDGGDEVEIIIRGAGVKDSP